MDVDATDLGQRLSELLQLVAAGEVIRITDQGVPVAMMSPITARSPLQRGIDEGWIRPPVRTGPLGGAKRAKARRRISDVLAEDRGR
jgi:hypothetical protein